MSSADYNKIKSGYATTKRSDMGNSTNRVLPRQVSTGTLRGTQKVGYGDVEIDASNNRITIGGAGESYIGMGTVPGFPDEVGFFTVDINGNLSMKIVGPTMYVYDEGTLLNTVQIGRLPNGIGGIAGSNQGFSVADGFS